MIRHIVFFTAPETEIDRVRAGLSLLTQIPAALTLEIGDNIKRDLFGNDVDLVVYGEFADAEALAAYKAHPIYQQSIDIVKPLREIRMAADFDSDSAAKKPLPL